MKTIFGKKIYFYSSEKRIAWYSSFG